MIFESRVDISKIWYFGNNRAKNLKLSPPKWHSPFFLTTDYNYAEEYSDYGVYTITLKGEAKSKILDFSKDLDVKKLKWPKELIDDIRTGKSDLNGIAYDMYILAGHGHSQEVFDKSWRLSDAAYDFDERSENIFDIVPKHASWASEKDHRFVLQMWKDIHDAGFDGFMHFEFGKKILALFDFKCMDKISIKPVKASLNEKQKNRALRKAFNARGQAAFPKIKSDDDIVFVSGIPKKKALRLLKRARHDVSNFLPGYMKKAIKWSDDQIFGVFNKHDKRNVLAMASVSYGGDESGAAYLHEMTGFIKGGYGKKLVEHLLRKFKKVYGQIALEGSGTNSDPFRPNEKLRDKFYATIPGLKIYRVQNSTWDCPADFFYYGISDESIKKFLEKTYSKDSRAVDESTPHGNARLSYYDVYMKSHPVDNISSLLDELVSEFAEDMQHCGISTTDGLSQQIYQKNGHINEHILDKIAKKMTRRYVWRKIKADVYAAIVSRFANVMQQTNNQELLENSIHFSRMVSRKTIEDCLDIICHNVNVLDANAILTTSLDVDLAQSVFKKHDLVNDIKSPYSNKTYEDCSIAAALYSVWASFAPGINSKYMCRSANAPDKIRDILNSISYDASSIDLIVALNRALDVVHCQNDLSLAFIEGGKQTLSKVSSLKSDQIYEDGHQFYDIDKNDEVVAKCRNPIGKIGISTYDDINAAGIGSFEIFKPYRRMGHAKNVLQKLVQKLKSKYSLVYCFVDKDNYPALSLYKQLGKVSNHLNANGQYEVEFWKAAEDNQSTASRNIKDLFDEVVSQYIALFGIDLSYMTFKVDSQPVYTNGEPCYEYDEDECAGDWTSLGWIRLNPGMKSVMDRYGVAWHGSDDAEEFTKIIIAHELAHEVWNNIADDQFKEEILDEARQQEFNTVYLDTVRPSKLAEETFCEYLAHKITQHRQPENLMQKEEMT